MSSEFKQETHYGGEPIHRVNVRMDDGTEESFGFASRASAKEFLQRILDRLRGGEQTIRGVRYLDGGKVS